MAKNKMMYVIYGVSTELMRAAKSVVPKTARMLLQNSRYFDPKSLVAADKVIVVDDFNADAIKKAYQESDAHADDVMLDVDIEVPEKGQEPTVTAPESGRKITEVKGLGKKTAETLAEAGVETLEDLAALNDDVEAKAEETGIENLADFIAKAEELLKDE